MALQAFVAAGLSGAVRAVLLVLACVAGCALLIAVTSDKAKTGLLWFAAAVGIAAPYLTVIFLDTRWRSR